jgi:putative heme-binding domain-containing protein
LQSIFCAVVSAFRGKLGDVKIGRGGRFFASNLIPTAVMNRHVAGADAFSWPSSSSSRQATVFPATFFPESFPGRHRFWSSCMRFLIGLTLFALLATPMLASAQGKKRDPNVAPTDPLPPEEQLKKFKLPPGFAIQLVAAEPKIKKPINIAFDAMGRLWVTGSEEYPFAAPPDRPGKDTVKILSDFGPDGRAGKVTTYADGLNIPIGVLPVPGGALVYSIPNLYFMPEKDGVAAGKQILYSQFGAKDTHGMTGEFVWGFDGWIYCCHGFSNTSKVKGKGADSIEMTSGNTYRIKLDGSKIEAFTRGQVNPFGMCTDPWGNLFTADCHTRPLYQLLKGAYYPSFGRPHDGFGPEMVKHDHGSTAIAGVVSAADETWPAEFKDNLFVGNVMTARINRDRLEKHGSTLQGIEMPDFVKCDDPWFRPVDLKLGPDGAIYVADFYNRIIGHYEVDLKHPGRDREKGRIWRIVPVDDSGKPKLHPVKNLPAASSEELIAALQSPNLTVRLDATHLLAQRGADVPMARLVEAAQSNSPHQKAHALWVLARVPANRDGAILVDQLKESSRDNSPLVRTHVQRILSERETWTNDVRSLALAGLADSSADVKRAAAQALAAHPEFTNVDPLLALRREVPADDTHLLHVVRMAIRDHFKHEATAKAIALRIWPEPQLSDLADVCPGAHTVQAARFLANMLKQHVNDFSPRKEYVHTVVRYGSTDDRATMSGILRDRFANNPGMQASLLKTMQQALEERGERLGGDDLKLAEAVISALLPSQPVGKMLDAIDLAQALKLPSSLEPLLKAIRATKGNPKLRASAIAAMVSIDPAKSQAPLAALLVDDREDLAVREQVAQALAGANQPKAHETLIQALNSAPARLQTTIAFGMAGSPQGAEKLLDAVALGKASPRLLQDRGLVLKLQQAKVAKLDDRLASLTKGQPAADQKLQELLAARKTAFAAGKWDAAPGQAIFQKHCAACHQIANQGSKIGPQLDGIGARGVDRLLEDILDPSRNVDQAFRTTSLELQNGQFLSGLLLREEGEVLVMADAQGKDVRVQKKDVVNRNVGPLSPMPANFWEQVPEEDFQRMMAYLLAQRPKS